MDKPPETCSDNNILLMPTSSDLKVYSYKKEFKCCKIYLNWITKPFQYVNRIAMTGSKQ